MKQLSHIIVYRDSPKSQVLYFGPFVDRRLAGIFEDELPVPLQGGYKAIKPVQPFSYSDMETARQSVLQDRAMAH